MPVTRNQSNAASQAKMSAASTSGNSSSKDSSDQGGTSGESERPPRHDSPENCSICLGPFNNKSFTSSCAHSFCFVCLKQWSKVKAECPLCKQPFTSIFYNIRSNQLYDIYELPHQPPNPNQFDYNIFNYLSAPISTFTGPSHHLFSLSQPPAFDADLTLSNFSRFQFRHRRYDRYLNPVGIHGEHAYSFGGPAVNPTTHLSAATWPRGADEFRREVYRSRLGPPAVIIGCENSNYRLTPVMVAASAHRIHRIMPWLTRELRVLLRSHQNVRLAISIIQPLLSQVTIDSTAFFDKIAPLIGRRSRQFIQEFVAFANSALNIQAYDRKAMYRRRDTAASTIASSSSSPSSDDVVEVADFNPQIDSVPGEPSQSQPLNLTHPSSFLQGPSQSQALNLSRTGWDSPAPGPSWERSNTQELVIDSVSVSSESDDPVFIPELRHSDSDESKAGSDLVFVKYDKPWNERSPINLTTDSETAEVAEQPSKKKKSKHKKKKREGGDVAEAIKDKKEKIKKSKHKDKSKSSDRLDIDSDEEVTSGLKRHNSQSSSEHHRTKKRKKSKNKKDKSAPMSDRDIVDRYFASAMLSQQRNVNDVSGEVSETSGKKKEKKRAETSHDKTKRKKKSKKHNKEHHQSSKQIYKKHPSGHKKTSNRQPEGSIQDQHQRHFPSPSPVRHNPLAGTSGSLGGDDLTQHEASSSAISHSVVPGFQAPYLSMPDTVQHIPVNLWVSTWPALSVSHTYPPPPPLPVGQNIPQSSSSSTVASNSNIAATSRPTLSISSSNSSDSSESESDEDARGLHIPPLQNVHSRTKQWLETNFPELGRPSASQAMPSILPPTSSLSYAPSTSATFTPSVSTVKKPQPFPQANREDNLDKQAQKAPSDVEVVSVPSGDEDILICSSDDNDSSTDLWVIGEEASIRNKQANRITQINLPSSSTCNISTLSFDESKVKSVESTKPPTPQTLASSSNKHFQPFQLPKKSAMSGMGKDPFFPSMEHSSDEDGETGVTTHKPIQPVAESKNIINRDFSKFKDDEPSNSEVLSATQRLSNVMSMIETLHSPLDSINAFPLNSNQSQLDNTNATISSSFPRISNVMSMGEVLHYPVEPTCSSSLNNNQSSLSGISATISSTLPISTCSVTTAQSNLSSSINYFPYAKFPSTTSASCLLPNYMPQPVLPSVSNSSPISFPSLPALMLSHERSSRNMSSNVPSLSNTSSLSLPSESNQNPLPSESNSQSIPSIVNLSSLSSATDLLPASVDSNKPAIPSGAALPVNTNLPSLSSDSHLSTWSPEGNLNPTHSQDNLNPTHSQDNLSSTPCNSFTTENSQSLPLDNYLLLPPECMEAAGPSCSNTTSGRNELADNIDSIKHSVNGAVERSVDTCDRPDISENLIKSDNNRATNMAYRTLKLKTHNVSSCPANGNVKNDSDSKGEFNDSDQQSNNLLTPTVYKASLNDDQEKLIESPCSYAVYNTCENGVVAPGNYTPQTNNLQTSSCVDEGHNSDDNHHDGKRTNLTVPSTTSNVSCVKECGDDNVSIENKPLSESDNHKLFDALCSTDDSIQEDLESSRNILGTINDHTDNKIQEISFESNSQPSSATDSGTVIGVSSSMPMHPFSVGSFNSSSSGFTSSEGSALFKPYIDHTVQPFTDALISTESSGSSSSSTSSEVEESDSDYN